jgi:hypothetical protein
VVRLEVQNPELALKPDMYADIEIKHTAGEGIIIPSEAVIRSGERNIVFVVRGEGKFAPRDVTLGLSLDDQKMRDDCHLRSVSTRFRIQPKRSGKQDDGSQAGKAERNGTRR